jgi:hypothetical protein
MSRNSSHKDSVDESIVRNVVAGKSAMTRLLTQLPNLARLAVAETTGLGNKAAIETKLDKAYSRALKSGDKIAESTVRAVRYVKGKETD